MTITVGEKKLAISRPADLDDRLVAATGCSAAEHAAMLAEKGKPFQIARALHPLLGDKDAPSEVELGAMIAAADVDAVRADTVALLKPVEKPAAPKAD